MTMRVITMVAAMAASIGAAMAETTVFSCQINGGIVVNVFVDESSGKVHWGDIDDRFVMYLNSKDPRYISASGASSLFVVSRTTGEFAFAFVNIFGLGTENEKVLGAADEGKCSRTGL